MLTTNEIIQIKEKAIENQNEESLQLVAEIERLNKEAWDYKNIVLRKLTSLENDMNRLVEENLRLIAIKDSAYVERDSCIGLIVQLAVANGITVGVKENTVVVELASGQVAWDFDESEAHLFEGLPAYSKVIENIEITEKYRRVMNPGIRAPGAPSSC